MLTEWLAGFFKRYPRLRGYARIRVIQKTQGGGGTHGEARQSGDEIWLFPKFWGLPRSVQDAVFAHEIGHYVLSKFGSANFLKVCGEVGVDAWDTLNLPYGQFNFDEAFAECFQAFVLNPSELKSRYPAWFEVVSRVVSKVKTAAVSDRVLYFAYGSNLDTDRMTARIPSAIPIATGYLSGWSFRFNKLSKDGTSRANIVPSKDSVWGVLYQIPVGSLEVLDQIEGGYSRASVKVAVGNTRLPAVTYVSQELTNADTPDWYKDIVVRGAYEHGVPPMYLKRVLKTSNKTAAARYKSKKKIKTKDGEERTVYEYSERQIQYRNNQKAERLEKLRKSIDKLRKQVDKDLKSKDEKTRATALAIALMDHTFERVGNEDSAEDGHFGVTTWEAKHVNFNKGNATITYVGKSGVDQKKTVTDSKLVKLLKELCDEKEPSACLVDATAADVNKYLEPFDISAKDIRGFHANTEMKKQLKKVRKGELPEDKKKREEKLKKEFTKALEETAKAVGHEPSTLRNQYLVPGVEDDYMKDGTVSESHKKKSSLHTAALQGTPLERYLLIHAKETPILLSRSRSWWRQKAPNLYRVASATELPRPHIQGLRFDPELFTTLWYEDREGNNLGEGTPSQIPKGSLYQHSQFPNVLKHNVLLLNEDGTSTSVFSGSSSFPVDLVTAMVRSGDWDVGDAIMVAGNGCERCLNVLLHHYLKGDGYPFGSSEYWRCGTVCDLCEHHVKQSHKKGSLQLIKQDDFGQEYLGDVRKDTFVHFTPRSRAEQIVKSGKLLMRPPYKKFGTDNITAVSLLYGEYVPGVQTTHTKTTPDDPMVAVLFKTKAKPKYGYSEEVVWREDVPFFGPARIISVSRAVALIRQAPEKIPEDAMVRYAGRKEKSDSEREDEQAQKMLRKEPKKKPPRYDLRNNRTLQERDKDLEGLDRQDGGDKDLQVDVRRYARRVAFRWLALPSLSPVRLAVMKQARKDRKPGDYWKTDSGQWAGKNRKEETRTFDSEAAAKGFAQGKSQEDAEKEPGKKTPQQEVKEEIKRLKKILKDGEDDTGELNEFERKKYERELNDSQVREIALQMAEDEDGDPDDYMQEAEDALKKQQKDQQKKREKNRQDRALGQVNEITEELVGPGSSLPESTQKEVQEALAKMDTGPEAKVFMQGFKKSLQELLDIDHFSEKQQARSVSRANKAVERDLTKISDPAKLAEAVAEMVVARNVVANPKILGGKPISDKPKSAEELGARAKEAFSHYRGLSPELRQSAAETLSEELKAAKGDRAKEIQSILTGIAAAEIVNTPEGKDVRELPGVSQPSAKAVRMVQRMDQQGKLDSMFAPVQDLTSPASRAAMLEAMGSMSNEELIETLKSEDKEDMNPFVSILEDPEMSEDVKEAIRQAIFGVDIDYSTWMDRAVRDVTGEESAQKRELILSESRGKSSDELINGITDAAKRGDLDQLRSKDPSEESQGGSEVESTSLLDAWRVERIQKPLSKILEDADNSHDSHKNSPSVAVLREYTQTRDPRVLETEVEPHPESYWAGQQGKKTASESHFSLYRHPQISRGPSYTFIQSSAPPNRRLISMPKLTKKGARQVTADLDRLATLFQKEYQTLGIPEKIARDMALRCDMLSDRIESVAGISRKAQMDPPANYTESDLEGDEFDPSEIGEEYDGAFLRNEDEPYMDVFKQDEFDQLREVQQDGMFSNAKAAASLVAKLANRLSELDPEFAAQKKSGFDSLVNFTNGLVDLESKIAKFHEAAGFGRWTEFQAEEAIRQLTDLERQITEASAEIETLASEVLKRKKSLEAEHKKRLEELKKELPETLAKQGKQVLTVRQALIRYSKVAEKKRPGIKQMLGDPARSLNAPVKDRGGELFNQIEEKLGATIAAEVATIYDTVMEELTVLTPTVRGLEYELKEKTASGQKQAGVMTLLVKFRDWLVRGWDKMKRLFGMGTRRIETATSNIEKALAEAEKGYDTLLKSASKKPTTSGYDLTA